MVIAAIRGEEVEMAVKFTTPGKTYALKSGGLKQSNTPVEPGVNPGPVAPPDAAAVSESVDGILLTPSTVQSQADVDALMKRPPAGE
jgi:hypothetical protein